MGGRLRAKVGDEFMRGRGAPTILYHLVTSVRVVVRCDHFTFAGKEVELRKKQSGTMSWFPELWGAR